MPVDRIDDITTPAIPTLQERNADIGRRHHAGPLALPAVWRTKKLCDRVSKASGAAQRDPRHSGEM
jgi:hypothetical protein